MAPKKADYQIIAANLLCTTCTLAADLLARSQTPSEWNMTSVPALLRLLLHNSYTMSIHGVEITR